MRKKNPVIEKARIQGYQSGFEDGGKSGFEQGKYSACMYFAEQFAGLEMVKGIGPKTLQLIINHFGKEYFEDKK